MNDYYTYTFNVFDTLPLVVFSVMIDIAIRVWLMAAVVIFPVE